MAAASEFVYRWVPGTDTSAPLLLLLHGTGGNEEDLLGLGKSLLPGAPLLSPRGRILENGMPRFFRRLAEGVFDEADLRARTHELADFLQSAVTRHGLSGRKTIAVGYSNGANIAASMLLLRPGALSGALLLRAMVPIRPDSLPDLSGVPVLLLAGRADTMIPPDNVERLATMLHESGADVDLQWSSGGHGLTAPELAAAQTWLAKKRI